MARNPERIDEVLNVGEPLIMAGLATMRGSGQ